MMNHGPFDDNDNTWSFTGLLSSLLSLVSTEPTQQVSGPLTDNPNDVVLQVHLLPVQTYVPRYQLAQTTETSAQAFKAEMQEGTLKCNLIRKDLLKACHSPQDALDVLTNDELVQHLHYFDLFKIAGLHPRLALKILEDETIQKSLHGKILAYLGRHHVLVAHKILEDPNAYKMDRFDQARLGTINEAIASQFLNDYHRENPYALVRMAAHHEALALTILKEMKENYKVFKFDLKFPLFYRLGRFHLSVAEAMFADNTIMTSLLEYDLSVFGSYHETIALKILDTPHYYQKMRPEHLSGMCFQHKAAARKLLEKTDCVNVASGYHIAELGQKHLDIALRIYNDPNLRNRLDPSNLCFLAQHHESLAQSIVADSEFCNKLNSYSLRMLGKANAFIAQYILDSDSLLDKMKDTYIAKMLTAHPSVALEALKSDRMVVKLGPYGLWSFGKSHFMLARYILNHLKEKLYDPRPTFGEWGWLNSFYSGPHIGSIRLVHQNRSKKQVTVIERVLTIAKEVQQHELKEAPLKIKVHSFGE